MKEAEVGWQRAVDKIRELSVWQSSRYVAVTPSPITGCGEEAKPAGLALGMSAYPIADVWLDVR
jgi:hypothetical protein